MRFEKISPDEEENAAYARGVILHSTVQLEMMMNLYIAGHYSGKGEPRYELIHSVFGTNKISFDSKIELFKAIVEKHRPDFKMNNPSYFKDLKDIIEHRNVFAHLLFSLESDEATDSKQKITFLKFRKNDWEYINVSYETINVLVDKINKYTTIIGEIAL